MLASLSALAGLGAADFQPSTLALGAIGRVSACLVWMATLMRQDFAEAKVLVVVFTCNHCPTAQYYESRLKQTGDRLQGRGVAVVAIMPNDPKSVRLDELGWTDLSDSFKEMKIRASDRQFNFPYLYDGDTEEGGPAPTAPSPHRTCSLRRRQPAAVCGCDGRFGARSTCDQALCARCARLLLLAGQEPPVTRLRLWGVL